MHKEKDPQDINLAELDVILKDVNMTLVLETTVLHTLTGKARVHTKEASEMLVR